MPEPEMQPGKPASTGIAAVLAGRRKLLIGAIVLVLAMGYFIFTAMESAAVYYLTVGEVLEQKTAGEPETFRVNGNLVPDSFQREAGSMVASFSLTDGESTLSAQYDGVVPDLFFNSHSEIILEGQYENGGVFDVDAVLVKCPSKYVALEESA